MEIRIGIKNSPRELTFDTDSTPEEVRSTIESAASGEHGFLTLSDTKNREYFVATKAIAFIEFGGDSTRRVGFVS